MKIFGITSNSFQAKIYIVIAETLEEANVIVSEEKCGTGEYEVLWVYEADGAEKPGVVADYRPDSLTSTMVMQEIKERKCKENNIIVSCMGFMPAECDECHNMLGHFHNLIKGKEIKAHVCHKCMEKLTGKGWIVYSTGMH